MQISRTPDVLQLAAGQRTLTQFLDEAPQFAEAYRQFAAAGATGHLSELDVELISVAVNASTTLMHEEALRVHIRNALALGATREQLLEVFELASVIGIHTVTMGMPILLDEANRRRATRFKGIE